MLDPIDINIWEPMPDKPGYVRDLGPRSRKAIFEELEDRLIAASALPEEYFGLAALSNPSTAFPEHHWIACFPVTGDSEGHYIHVEAINHNSRELVFLGKTFQGFDFAAKCAVECARALGA